MTEKWTIPAEWITPATYTQQGEVDYFEVRLLGDAMPDTETPALPLLCDHDGCQLPAVGRYVVGGNHRQFEEVLRCEKHAGVAECKEKVNNPNGKTQ